MFDDVVESEGWRQVSGPPPCCPGEPAGCEHERAVIAELEAEHAEQLNAEAALALFGTTAGHPVASETPSSLLERVDRWEGLSLAGTLAALDLSELDGGELVDAAAAWSRVAAWAQAHLGETAALLSEELHRLSGPVPGAGVQGLPAGSTPQRLAATELSMRLGATRQSAERLVRTGRLLHGPLQATGEALERGQIDQRKAEIIAEALENVPLPISLAVEDAVLPTAGRRTHPQVSHDLAKALIECDADAATTRHRRARARRRVNHPRALPDGMAAISAVLPAQDAVALDLALDAVARTAKSHGDQRTIDQLRADALAQVGVDALRTGHLGRRPGCRCVSRPPASAGPPGAAAAAGPPGAAPGSGEPSSLGTIGGELVRVQVTVPFSTLMGGEAPGELDGYGPIDPATARALAVGGIWRRLVTDPLSGTVVDVGRRRYRPPPDLARLVRARDRTCVRPGCGARAAGCDLDHTVPFGTGPDGGATALHNLGAQCRTDHVLKTNGDFRVRQLPGGVFEWTSRTGHTYRREATGTITHLGRTHAPDPRRSPSAAQAAGRGDDADPADLPSMLEWHRSGTGGAHRTRTTGNPRPTVSRWPDPGDECPY